MVKYIIIGGCFFLRKGSRTNIKVLKNRASFGIIIKRNFNRGEFVMKFSYKPLWKLLIDKDMSNKDLLDKTGISKSTLHKLKSEKNVNTDILLKICTALECDISDIVECVEQKEGNY